MDQQAQTQTQNPENQTKESMIEEIQQLEQTIVRSKEKLVFLHGRLYQMQVEQKHGSEETKDSS